ncbi:ABC transporter permease [Methanobacterium ferruginis]|uniref:ABC transporter permease n=1 Tax=Methanobacterium ferruginis TaxID=710191 RepID=UPI002573EEAB|nr:ABC transporter permease [Methanobacterium ferruginis]BDZ67009.1 ABC transporter permease [Methanobacterium ferruginis]
MSGFTSDIKYTLKSFFRNKRIVFWTLFFPIVLFLLFGYIFGSQSDSINLYYQDNDGSQMSNSFIQSLNSTGAVNLKSGSDMDLSQMLKDGKISAYLIIPSEFGQNVLTAQHTNSSSSSGIQVYYDKSKSSSMAVVSIVQQVTDSFNMKMSNTQQLITVDSENAATKGMNYFDFLLPGILAICIMSAINMAVGGITHLRDIGLFRKLSTTPFTSMQWIGAKIIVWTTIVVLSLVLPLVLSWLAFGTHPNINLITVLLVIAGTAMFAGLGIIFANYAKDSESAVTAVMAITFPLMFISGTFIPVENMPWFLQYIANISPLTYLSNGLRSSMITGNYGDAVTNLAIVGVLGIVLFGIGVAVFNWKED